MVEIKAKMRSGFGPGNLHRHLRPGTVLAEKRIHRLEQDRLPSGRHLGDLGYHAGLAVEIEFAAIQAVVPLHVDVGAGYEEMKKRKTESAVFEDEIALQIDGHILDHVFPGQLRFALTAQTEAVDFLLHLGIAEVRA